MVVVLLMVLFAAPLVLGPLLIYTRYRGVMPRVVLMDEDAAYAPDLFRHLVWSQEREWSALGFHLLGCTVASTGTGRARYTAVFGQHGPVDLVMVTAAFEQDRYRAPRQLAYTETEIVSRVHDGTWIVTGDVHMVRPGSYRVRRFAAGRRPAETLLRIHQRRIGEQTRRVNAGLPGGSQLAAMVQEAVESQEIYDALARRDLMQDEETGEIRATWLGACIIGWRHFGFIAWALRMVRLVTLRRPTEVPVADEAAVEAEYS